MTELLIILCPAHLNIVSDIYTLTLPGSKVKVIKLHHIFIAVIRYAIVSL